MVTNGEPWKANNKGLDFEVLVHAVKLAQKQGLKGAKGGWKDFLNYHDKKFGDGLSDPAKRSMDVLVAFLETFTEKKDCLFFSRIMRGCSNHKAVERFIKKFPDLESPEQHIQTQPSQGC